MKHKVNWDAIETAYCAGILSVREIAKQHNLPHTTVTRRARREGWARDLSVAIDRKTRAVIAAAQSVHHAVHQGDAPRSVGALVQEIAANRRMESERHIIESAATLVAAVQIAHRNELAGLREKASQYRDALTRAEQDKLPLKEAVDLFARLSAATIAILKAEREAYGIDRNASQTPDAADRCVTIEVVHARSGDAA